MSDQQPATDLEAAVRFFAQCQWARFKLPDSDRVYLVIPESAVNALRWEIDPSRPEPGPYVSVYPGMKSGQPTLNRTRLDVETVVAYVWAGHSFEEVARSWNVSRAEILVCCWFVGEHGSRTWRKRWGAWAQSAYEVLARGAEAPWPPTAR